MSWAFPTNVEKLATVTKQLNDYRALYARHEARNFAKGGKCVGVMVARREREQAILAERVGLTIGQADHLYV